MTVSDETRHLLTAQYDYHKSEMERVAKSLEISVSYILREELLAWVGFEKISIDYRVKSRASAINKILSGFEGHTPPKSARSDINILGLKDLAGV